MTSYVEKLTHLKQLVETSADLSEPFRYFMDDIALHPAFIADSFRTKNKLIVTIIKRALKEYFNLAIDTNQCMIMEYKEDKNFHHGLCMMSGHMLVFFHFVQLRIGMVLMSDPRTGMSNYIRFRAIITNGEITFHPGDPTVTH